MRPKQKVREVAVALFGEGIGCGDGSCYFGHPGGMQTNGGCGCSKIYGDTEFRLLARKLSMIAHALAKQIPGVSE